MSACDPCDPRGLILPRCRPDVGPASGQCQSASRSPLMGTDSATGSWLFMVDHSPQYKPRHDKQWYKSIVNKCRDSHSVTPSESKPSHTRRGASAVLLLGRRCRRWANVHTALVCRHVSVVLLPPKLRPDHNLLTLHYTDWSHISIAIKHISCRLQIWFDTEQNAIKDFSVVYCSSRGAYIQNLPASSHAKSIIFKMASKMAAKYLKLRLSWIFAQK